MATSDAPLNVPNVTLAVARGGAGSGSASLTDNGNGTITITGSGFGNTAPIFCCLIDPNASANGTSLLSTEVLTGPGTTVESDSMPVKTSTLQGGMALDVGTNSTNLGAENHNQFNVLHPLTRRVFESRTVYWPRANVERAVDYRDGTLADPHPGGSDTNQAWQIKTVWNLADQTFTGADTNFFFVGFARTIGTNPTRFAEGLLLSSNNGEIDRELTNDGFATLQRGGYNGSNPPLDEPYTLEFGWDQGDVSVSTTQGTLFGQVYSSIFGVQSESTVSPITLSDPTGPVKNINSFNYPGFIRGFNRPLGCGTEETQIYRQIGAGAYARVAICDTSNYKTSKSRVLLPPNSWSDTEITCQLPVWQQALSAFSGKYICVVDADNNQVGEGELI